MHNSYSNIRTTIISLAAVAVFPFLAVGCSEDETSVTYSEDASDNKGTDAGNRSDDNGSEVSDDSGVIDNGSQDDGARVDSSAPEPIVNLADGPIKGVIAGDTFRFMGIPFAAPPTGDFRWRPPQPVKPWEEVRDASEPWLSCIQFGNALADVGETSEDCLYLNVWTPDLTPDESLPVLLWLHGGANMQSSAVARVSGYLSFDGQRFIEAAPQPVVVVTADYRLGQLGFLAHPGLTREEGTSGNYGLMDQQAALRWVRDNISAFGGDPENVTLFGESAGAEDACLQFMAPGSEGLFHRVILESAPSCYSGRWRRDLVEAEAGGSTFADFVDCKGADDAEVVECLRGLTVEELQKSVETETLPGGSVYQEPSSHGFVFQPIIDGVFLPKPVADVVAADQQAKIPVIVGTNKTEGTLFHHEIVGAILPADEDEYKAALERRFGDAADAVAAEYPVSDYDTPNDALIEVTGDSLFVCPARNLARALTDQGGTVFEYNYTHEVGFGFLSSLGATHAAEVFLVWGGASLPEEATDSYKAVASTIVDYWTRFAYTGDPNDDDAPQWPRFKTDTEPEIVLADPVSTVEGRKSDRCDFWATIR